tara:strand:+ start:570 stop:710 length:141 start_codon:yes stop_codon:yes gene_type:complete
MIDAYRQMGPAGWPRKTALPEEMPRPTRWMWQMATTAIKLYWLCPD